MLPLDRIELPVIYLRRFPFDSWSIDTILDVPQFVLGLSIMAFCFPFIMTVRDIIAEKENHLRVCPKNYKKTY